MIALWVLVCLVACVADQQTVCLNRYSPIIEGSDLHLAHQIADDVALKVIVNHSPGPILFREITLVRFDLRIACNDYSCHARDLMSCVSYAAQHTAADARNWQQLSRLGCITSCWHYCVWRFTCPIVGLVSPARMQLR
jgi:hypothetical protein